MVGPEHLLQGVIAERGRGQGVGMWLPGADPYRV